MARKGKVAEILSKALYHDDPDLYLVGYIDLGMLRESKLLEFLREAENFEKIPASRITHIKRENKILFKKEQK